MALALSLASVAACSKPFKVDTPTGFVDLGDDYPRHEWRAVSADGVVVSVRHFDNDPKGGFAFWQKVIENRLRDEGYALVERKPVTSASGMKGVEMVFGHDQDNNPYVYRLALFVLADDIYLFEAAGKKDQMAPVDPAIRSALLSLTAN